MFLSMQNKVLDGHLICCTSFREYAFTFPFLKKKLSLTTSFFPAPLEYSDIVDHSTLQEALDFEIFKLQDSKVEMEKLVLIIGNNIILDSDKLSSCIPHTKITAGNKTIVY